MEKYVMTYSITVIAEGADKEQAENNGWGQLDKLLTDGLDVKYFSCHNYGLV